LKTLKCKGQQSQLLATRCRQFKRQLFIWAKCLAVLFC